jgi:hypothetical protein
MGKLINILLVGGFLGLMLYKGVITALEQFQYKIIGYGIPQRSGLIVTLPIRFGFLNPTPIPITLDNLLVDIFLFKDNHWEPAAQVNQPFTIAAGNSEQIVNASINFGKILGGNVFDTLATILRTNTVHIYIEVTATIKGIKLPTQKFQQAVNVIS